jgi:hypothetical protein
MLAVEVEYIHSESDIFEDRVVLDNLRDGTIVVKKDMFRHGTWKTVSPFNHFLEHNEHHLL